MLPGRLPPALPNAAGGRDTDPQMVLSRLHPRRGDGPVARRMWRRLPPRVEGWSVLSSGFGIPTCPTRAVSALARPRPRRREGAAGRNRGGAAAGAIFGAGGSVALRSLRASRAGVALLYDRRRQTCRHRRRPHHLAVHASSRANRPGPPAAQEATRPSAQRRQRGQRMQWHGTKEAGRWVEADWHPGSCWRARCGR